MWKKAGDSLEALRQSIEAEMIEKIGTATMTEDEFPCMYAETSDPHPPICEGEWKCDGYGNMIHQSTGCIGERRCKCFRSHAERKRQAAYLQRLPLPTRLAVEQADPQGHALGLAIERWNFETPGLLLLGVAGTGKTIAGHRIVLEWIKRANCEGVFFSTQKIADEFRRIGFGDSSEKEEIGRRILHREDLAKNKRIAIFLDDLGQSRETEAVIQDIRGIIRSRYENHGVFILTTNLSGDAIRETYGADILDRLRDPRWMKFVKIDAKSVRSTFPPNPVQPTLAPHWTDR